MKRPANNRTSSTKVAVSSLIGTSIEWYDFFIFNAATALLIFPKLFFKGSDPNAAMLLSLSVYAIGFVARPIGGIVCGHFGDRVGRKSMLVTTLLITGMATFLIGLLPTYEQIGLWAPVLLVLLRFAQGFAIGGEWGGAVLMAVEYAPGHKRGLYGGWAQVGAPIGLFVSNIVFFGILARLPESALLSGWWRVPFLLSILLVALGLYIRLAVDESPKFDEIKEHPSKVPFLNLFQCYRRDILVAMGAKVAENGLFYLYTVFVVTFSVSRGIPKGSVLFAISTASLLTIVAIPLFSYLSDQIGRRRIYLFGAIFGGVFAFPSFLMIASGNAVLMTVAVVCALVLGWAAMYAPQASFFSELFETRVRYSGASLGAQVITIFSGGLMQIVIVSLSERTGSYWPVALILVGMSVVTTISVLLASETLGKNLSDSSTRDGREFKIHLEEPRRKSDITITGLTEMRR